MGFVEYVPHKYELTELTGSHFWPSGQVVGNSDRYDNGIPPFRAQSYRPDKNEDPGHNDTIGWAESKPEINRLNMTWAID